MSTSDQHQKFPRTYWREIGFPSFEKLSEDISVDIAIVGAGITGITAAYLLAKEGVKVAIIEAGGVLNGTTGHTTAKITAQHGLFYDELISHFGEDKARQYYESNISALEFIQQTSKELGIDCDFSQQDACIYSTTDQYAEKIDKEWDAYQTLGIHGYMAESIPFPIEIKNALYMKNQGQYHPLKFMKGLLNEAVKMGCQVYENTTAMEIEEIESSRPKVVTKDGHRVSARKVIVASHFPFFDGMGMYFARMYAERSYAIGVKTDQEYPGGMYISADDPSRSIRYTPYGENGEKLLVIGGENHRTGTGQDTLTHYNALQQFTKDTFGIESYSYRWSAQDLKTLDKVPYIGHITDNKENILVATGYKKWGMTTGVLAGHILTDLAMDRENPYKDLYTPSRFKADPSLQKAVSYNAAVAGHLLKGKLELVPKDAGDLKNGEGSVVMHNGKRAGGYRDENGKLYLVDTTCTHLGCECEWNHAEKTWDCPCHGSRFAYSGEVVEGPALVALKNPLEED